MTIEYRTTASAGAGLDFVLSDASMDRHGTRINPKGWDLSTFKTNPVALFGHRSDFPIGKWENVRVEGGKLVGRLALAARGTSARIDELISLVEQGILRAVSVGFEPLEMGKPGDDFEIKRQSLIETSLVSVGSNKNALAMARSLNISEETLSLAFGEQAIVVRDLTATGKQADTTSAELTRSRVDRLPSSPKVKSMSTLSQRIEDAQNDLNAKRDRLVELNGAEPLDLDAIEALTADVDVAERTITALKASEAKVGIRAAVAAPAVARSPLGFKQKEVKGLDLLVRAVTAKGLSFVSGKAIERVLDERYPGHEATALMCRADQTLGTTTGSHWADDIVRTTYADFLGALTGKSVYPDLRARGIGLSFDGNGTVSIPSRTGGTANGSFVAEGSPIRVGKVTTASTTMTARKMGVIVPFSRELAKRSTPAIEALVRQAIIEDTAATLDSKLLDATAGDSARPAGLLNGVSATASGYGGGDHQAVKADFQALLAPFIAANAADNITVIMNPAQGLAIAMMDGPTNNANWFGPIAGRVNLVESTHATANRLIAIRNSDFATALGDAPEFDISEQATIHMEDTTPLEIVSGTGPTTADPVRSLWQTASIGVRMIMDVSWKMRRSGMVAWIDTTSY
jgi:HK97 family phage major capsid protein/HK97 family phage prohead protease